MLLSFCQDSREEKHWLRTQTSVAIFFFFSLGAFRAPATTNWTMHHQQNSVPITFPQAHHKNKERLHITSEHKGNKSVDKFVSKSLQTALRKSEDIAIRVYWAHEKIAGPNMESIYTRQVGDKTRGDRNKRPIQQPSKEKICGKRVARCKCKSHWRYLSLSTCCSAWQYCPLVKFLFRKTGTSLWFMDTSSHDQTCFH